MKLPVKDRKCRPRITISGLSHGTGIAVYLCAEPMQGLNVSMTREKYLASNPRKILRAWFEVLINGVGPATVDQLHVFDPAKHRERAQPIHILLGQHFALVH